jgi:twitching motility protein PilT
MNSLLESLFLRCEECGASDIHLSPSELPRLRIRGELIPMTDYRTFDEVAVDEIAMELGLSTLPIGCSDGTERIRYTLLKEGALDGAISSPSGARYRFNVYREMNRHAIALRRLDMIFRNFHELGLPRRLEDFCNERDGMVIISGPTGSGKSTTLATMLNRINIMRCGHIVTIEDPIEYIHKSEQSLVHQRQVGRDTKSFNDALVEALRQDPDVILVGEMRDLDTMRTALRAAETGHLVFTTLHAGDCAGAIERMVSVFPAEEQPSVRHQLALVLRGICAQHLLPVANGEGRVPAVELLVNTTAVANMVATGRTQQIYSLIETGGQYGMCTLDESLATLCRSGKIAERTAMALSKNPEILRRRIGDA